MTEMRRWLMLCESYGDFPNRWVHYSKHEMLAVHPKGFHQDPTGLYFFPADEQPESTMWKKMAYKFTIMLKPSARVLNLPTMSDTDIQTMLVGLGQYDIFLAELDRYPAENHEKKVDCAWEVAKQAYSPPKWNRVLRQMGYDAVFDDRGIIYFSEPRQLLVLDPRIIHLLSREQPKRNYYAAMVDVVAQLKALCEPYGEVTVEEPRMRAQRWSHKKTLTARLDVHRSDDNYAAFTISHDSGTETQTHLISISLSYSQPSLGYGSGASFNVVQNEWEWNGLETIQHDLEKVFSASE